MRLMQRCYKPGKNKKVTGMGIVINTNLVHKKSIYGKRK